MAVKPQTDAARPYLIAVGIAVVVFLLHLFHFVNFHELNGVDLRLKIRGTQPGHEKIVIMEIDDPSLAAVGQWPWPRSIHAVLLNILDKYDPRLIFFDILFTEQGPDPEHDNNLAFAMQSMGNVILPFFYYSLDPFGAYFPLDKFKDAAVDVGYVNVDPDRDGVVRRITTHVRNGDKVYYHPSVLAMFFGFQKGVKAQEWFRALPTDRKNRLWVNYPGRMASFKRISFWEVIDAVGGERDQELRGLFENSIILVGHTATGTTDLKATPFTPLEPGVAIQASAIHTLLTGKFLRSSHWGVDLLILILLALGTAWVSQKRPPRQALSISFGVLAAYTLSNILLFYFLGWILPLFVPMAAVAVTYFVILFLKYIEARFHEELIQRELKTAARIQENFLPEAPPQVEGLDIAFACRFIKEVGGDLYDWIEFGNGQLAVCVGDVSGKGVPAALYMAKAMSEFRRDTKAGVTPADVNLSLNDHLARSGTAGMFLTFFYGVIDTLSKKLQFSSAGHDPMIFYRARDKKAFLREDAQGTPLGLFEGSPFETGEVDYEKGDVFVVVTDGIKELRNQKREEFGMDRLKALVEELAPQDITAAETIDAVFKALHEYQKGAAPHDDRTILCVRFKK